MKKLCFKSETGRYYSFQKCENERYRFYKGEVQVSAKKSNRGLRTFEFNVANSLHILIKKHKRKDAKLFISPKETKKENMCKNQKRVRENDNEIDIPIKKKIKTHGIEEIKHQNKHLLNKLNCYKQEKVPKLIERIKNSKSECQSIKNDLEKCQSDLEKSQSDLEKSQSDLKKSQSDLEKCQSDFKKSQSDLEKCQSDLKKSLSEYQSSKEKIEQLTKSITIKDLNIIQKREIIDRLQEDFAKSQTAEKELQEAIAEKDIELEKSQIKNAHLDEDFQHLKDNFETLMQTNEELYKHQLRS